MSQVTDLLNRIQSTNLAEYAAYTDVSDPLPTTIIQKSDDDDDPGIPIADLFDEELKREVAGIYDVD